MPKLVSVLQAAQLLGISRRMFQQYLDGGRVRGAKRLSPTGPWLIPLRGGLPQVKPAKGTGKYGRKPRFS